MKLLLWDKRRIKKRAQGTLNPNDIKVANNLGEALKGFNENRWRGRVSRLTNEDDSFWKVEKSLRRNRNRSKAIRHIQSLNDAAERRRFSRIIFSSYTKELQVTMGRPILMKLFIQIDETIRSLSGAVGEDLRSTTSEEIRHRIEFLKLGKAAGYDDVPNTSLRRLPKSSVDALAVIINVNLRIGHFPSAWKHATVISIPTSDKDPVFPQSCRLTFHISTIAELAQGIILNRFQEDILILDPIQNEQFGFREGHSTEFRLFRFTEAIGIAFDRRETLTISRNTAFRDGNVEE